MTDTPTAPTLRELLDQHNMHISPDDRLCIPKDDVEEIETSMLTPFRAEIAVLQTRVANDDTFRERACTFVSNAISDPYLLEQWGYITVPYDVAPVAGSNRTGIPESSIPDAPGTAPVGEDEHVKDTYPNKHRSDQYRDEKLIFTFQDSVSNRPEDAEATKNRVMVKMANEWTGIFLRWHIEPEYAEQEDVLMWTVEDMPKLGPFLSRGEALHAALVVTFDPDDDTVPAAADAGETGEVKIERLIVEEIMGEMQEKAADIRAVKGNPEEHKGWLRAISLVSSYLTIEQALSSSVPPAVADAAETGEDEDSRDRQFDIRLRSLEGWREGGIPKRAEMKKDVLRLEYSQKSIAKQLAALRRDVDALTNGTDRWDYNGKLSYDLSKALSHEQRSVVLADVRNQLRDMQIEKSHALFPVDDLRDEMRADRRISRNARRKQRTRLWSINQRLAALESRDRLETGRIEVTEEMRIAAHKAFKKDPGNIYEAINAAVYAALAARERPESGESPFTSRGRAVLAAWDDAT